MRTTVRSIAILAVLLAACGSSTDRASTEACAEIAAVRSDTTNLSRLAREALVMARAGVDELTRVGHCARAAGHISSLGGRLRYGEGRLAGIAAMVPGTEPSTFHVVSDLGASDASRLGFLMNTICAAGAAEPGLDDVVAQIDVVERNVAEHLDAAGCPATSPSGS